MDQFNIFATSCSNQHYFYLQRYISLWVSSMSTIIATYPYTNALVLEHCIIYILWRINHTILTQLNIILRVKWFQNNNNQFHHHKNVVTRLENTQKIIIQNAPDYFYLYRYNFVVIARIPVQNWKIIIRGKFLMNRNQKFIMHNAISWNKENFKF